MATNLIRDNSLSLLEFYRGYFIPVELRGASDESLEKVHDWVQHVFPLPSASVCVAGSPVAGDAFYEAFHLGDPVLIENATIAKVRFICFLTDTVLWLRAKDHNHLRISRAIRSLRLMGLYNGAQEIYDTAMAWGSSIVNKESISYWEEALKTEFVPSWCRKVIETEDLDGASYMVWEKFDDLLTVSSWDVLTKCFDFFTAHMDTIPREVACSLICASRLRSYHDHGLVSESRNRMCETAITKFDDDEATKMCLVRLYGKGVAISSDSN